MSKTVLITGASNGIGYELAKVHAENGDNLILVARSKNKLDELKYELEEKHTAVSRLHHQRKAAKYLKEKI